MNVDGAVSLNPLQQPSQAQVTVLKKSQDLQAKNVMTLINSVASASPAARPSGGNPPGVGQNINIVA
ncbi:MAG: putative motility protein [Magnetococcales bacterium]|nr:YjfB family protein [Magnetococcales bacterium]NGZ26041.1 putative motility protein [Magnetococcales bacterium]